MCGKGGVAQLGEHLLCKQGVIGSIPFTSTISVQNVQTAQATNSRQAIPSWRTSTRAESSVES